MRVSCVKPRVSGACSADLTDCHAAQPEVAAFFSFYPTYTSDAQDPALLRQLNKDTRINLASAGLFTAEDYLQARRISGRVVSADLSMTPGQLRPFICRLLARAAFHALLYV